MSVYAGSKVVCSGEPTDDLFVDGPVAILRHIVESEDWISGASADVNLRACRCSAKDEMAILSSMLTLLPRVFKNNACRVRTVCKVCMVK